MSPQNRYSALSDLPTQLPLFPLRGVILLPRTQIPLNVFEPRYLEMIDDAVSGSRLIGIIQPQPGDVPSESPKGKEHPLKPVGCAGRITGYQELEDGRYLITLTGICRFSMTNEGTSSKPYRIADAKFTDYIDDLKPDQNQDQIDRPKLMDVLKRFLESNQLRADWAAMSSAALDQIINALSVLSPFGSEEKQALLEAPDLKSRADVLMALANMDIASSGGAGTTLQ